MKETRTTIQIEAKKIDLDIFNLVRKLEQFAQEHHRPEATAMARLFDGMRYNIRQHMHKKDVKATQ